MIIVVKVIFIVLMSLYMLSIKISNVLIIIFYIYMYDVIFNQCEPHIHVVGWEQRQGWLSKLQLRSSEDPWSTAREHSLPCRVCGGHVSCLIQDVKRGKIEWKTEKGEGGGGAERSWNRCWVCWTWNRQLQPSSTAQDWGVSPSLLPRGYCLDKTRTQFSIFFPLLLFALPHPACPLSLVFSQFWRFYWGKHNYMETSRTRTWCWVYTHQTDYLF